MPKISPAIQISVGLVFVTVSLLFLADVIGLTPSETRQRFEVRKILAENIALQTKIGLRQGDRDFVESMLAQAVERNEEINSIAIRKENGLYAYSTEDHENYWGAQVLDKSSLNKISFALFSTASGESRLEIAFSDTVEMKSGYFGISYFIWLVVFVSVFGFTTFWFYLKRALKQFDPSQVVPARVRNALNIMAEGVLILDRRGQIVLANETFTKLLAIAERELIGRKASDLNWITPTYSDYKMPWVVAQQTGDKVIDELLTLNLKNQKSRVFSINAVPILDEKGKHQGVISSFDDITELEEKNELLQNVLQNLVHKQKSIEVKNKELNYLASRDPLTDCYNRRSLFDKLNLYFEDAEAIGTDYCVVMVDIDHFKRVNDTYGHNVGDEVIKGVAKIIRESLRKGDIVARFGGEEFCVVLPGVDTGRAMALAESIRTRVKLASFANVSVTASFGVSSLCFYAKDAKELIAQADLALYESKRTGRNKCTLWHEGLTEMS